MLPEAIKMAKGFFIFMTTDIDINDIQNITCINRLDDLIEEYWNRFEEKPSHELFKVLQALMIHVNKILGFKRYAS